MTTKQTQNKTTNKQKRTTESNQNNYQFISIAMTIQNLEGT